MKRARPDFLLLAESSLQADLNLITANRLERKNIEAKLEQSEAENRMLRESLNVADTKIKELTDQLARLQMQPSGFSPQPLNIRNSGWIEREVAIKNLHATGTTTTTTTTTTTINSSLSHTIFQLNH